MNIGVAAHITAASPGGPRFDAHLSPAERSAAANGIWLCQSCAKHVDNDEPQFTKALLLAWRASAEAYAQSLLTTPERPQRRGEPLLVLPSADPAAAWLSFSARASKLVGRADEYTELEAFLHSGRQFSWWLVTGPGGSGKSRLALELCHGARPHWSTGFLSRVDEFKDWPFFRPERPTLVVVDYVATRASDASAMILQLSRSTAYLPNPVRVLLLERDEGSWWSRFQREDSHSESAELAACQHGLPLHLGPLQPNDLFAIAADVARLQKLPWTISSQRAFETRIRTLDPLGRPLFAMIGADGFSGDAPDPVADSTALQRVLNREVSRWRQLLPDDERRNRIENLATLATLVGGILPRSGAFSFLANTDVAPLLPNPDFLDLHEYRSIVGAASNETTLAGLQPDILGERFALDRLMASGGVGQAAERLLMAAWTLQPDDLCDFVVRAASDYPGDTGLDAALWGLPLGSAKARGRWGRLAGDLLWVANRSGDPQSQKMLATLRDLVRAHPTEVELRNALARAELYLGNIFLFTERDHGQAAIRYETAITLAGPDSEITASAINNRGILNQTIEDEESAFADWSNVVAMNGASDEARACALNNRADVFAHRGAHEDAIRDRSAVLALPDTSHDRRYIALSRRSRSHLALGRTDEAFRDLEGILRTPDITPHQKANARMDRGVLLRDLGRLSEARQDFDAVLTADFVFPGTYADVLIELARLAYLERDPDRVREYLDAVTTSPDADHQTLVETLVIRARLLADAGDSVGAESIYLRVLANPSATARQKSIATRRGVSPAAEP